MLTTLTNLFPLWAVLTSITAYMQPSYFVNLKSLIIPLLVIIMLAMGLTLRPRDFANVALNRKAVAVGAFLQFSIMPLAALAISTLLGLDKTLTVGMVLVGSVAGGTSSNVMCYLAKGDVALSISMTALSTLLGVAITPLLTKFLAGQSVDVPTTAMLFSLVKIVLLPVSVGVLINHFFHKFTTRIRAALPLCSMLAIILIIAIVVALNAKHFSSIGPLVALAVILHNSTGLLLGYWTCRLLRLEENICRTISFEVGLQNSGLATALAMKFFSPAAAVPGTIFSVWHNLSGSLLAGYWAKK